MTKQEAWSALLGMIDRMNRAVKEPGWMWEDKDAVYEMKDALLARLLTEKPDCVNVQLFYVPYLQYSERTKDAAGEMMRRDGRRYPYEYYLAQMPLGEGDTEDPSRAAIEVLAECAGQIVSLHMSIGALPAEYDLSEIPRKKWIPAPQFHHENTALAKKQFAEYMQVLDAE